MPNLWAALRSLEMLPFPGRALSHSLFWGHCGAGRGVSSRKPEQGEERALGSDPKSSSATEHISKSDSSSVTSQHWQDNQRR